jgi:hypothetical protein
MVVWRLVAVGAPVRQTLTRVAGGTIQVRVSAFQRHRMLEAIFVLVLDKGSDLLDRLVLLVQFYRVPRDGDAYTSVAAYSVNVHRAVRIDLPDKAVQVAGMARASAATVTRHLTQNLWVPGSKLVSLAHRWQFFLYFLGKAQTPILLPVSATPLADCAQGDNAQ